MAHLQKQTEKLWQMHFRFGRMRTVPDRSNASPNCSDKQRTECSLVRCVRGGRAHHPSQITPREKSLPLTSCNNTTTTNRIKSFITIPANQQQTRSSNITNIITTTKKREISHIFTTTATNPLWNFCQISSTNKPTNQQQTTHIHNFKSTNKQHKEETWVYHDFSNGSLRDIPVRLHQSMTPLYPRSITYTWTWTVSFTTVHTTMRVWNEHWPRRSSSSESSNTWISCSTWSNRDNTFSWPSMVCVFWGFPISRFIFSHLQFFTQKSN